MHTTLGPAAARSTSSPDTFYSAIDDVVIVRLVNNKTARLPAIYLPEAPRTQAVYQLPAGVDGYRPAKKTTRLDYVHSPSPTDLTDRVYQTRSSPSE
jgi:hypothetical protein